MPSLRTIAELCRLPNVFSAAADILMGFFLAGGRWTEDRGVLVALLGASGFIYLAGMVLNDVFDVEQDLRERPERPIPSGRVSQRFAQWLGYEMLVVGLACGWLASSLSGQAVSGSIATGLAVAAWAYDAKLKRTPLGPLTMGLCRGLNVLLGASGGPGEMPEIAFVVAGGLAVYIVGVTWFARTEAVESRRLALVGAAIVMALGMALLASLPQWTDISVVGAVAIRNARAMGMRWFILWLLLAGSIGTRIVRAVVEPSPERVQAAVVHCLRSLIVLDASIAFAAGGLPAALAVVALLAPMLALGGWLRST